MLIDTPECFTEAGLKRIEEAEVILTNTDLNLEDYMTFLEKQEKKHKNISEKPILTIEMDDFNKLKQLVEKGEISLGIKAESEKGLSKAEILHRWTGFPIEKLQKVLKSLKTDFQLTNKLVGIIKEEEKRKAEAEKKK